MYLHRASWHSSASLTEVSPCFVLSFKARGTVRILPKFLCCSIFCVVLFIVCVQMCTVLLSPGGYPIAVNKYIKFCLPRQV